MQWRFTWRAEKAADNWTRHQVSFEEAQQTFDDPLGVEIFDSEHSSLTEQRFIRLGDSKNRLLFTVFTIDEQAKTVHIISSREPETWERRIYEEE